MKRLKERYEDIEREIWRDRKRDMKIWKRDMKRLKERYEEIEREIWRDWKRDMKR